jgi:hypothetical protein
METLSVKSQGSDGWPSSATSLGFVLVQVEWEASWESVQTK